jgi:hypothetical protein
MSPNLSQPVGRLVGRPTPNGAFPRVRHGHPNGTLDAVRDHTPQVVAELRGTPLVAWSYRCPCGSTYVLERER